MTKILLIEDEYPLRQEMMEWLTFENYEVTGAGDGVEGVNAAVLDPPDLIVCDISMPKLDGYGVLLDIQSNSALQLIPFIFLTAKTTHDDIRKGMQLGADDYLTKPCSRVELLEAIRVRLEKKEEHDIARQNQMNAFKEALTTEQEKRLLQAKLVAMFSHDFRNQLMVIRASALLIHDYADRLTPERQLERLEAIDKSTQVLMEMIEDMLNMAQMDTGSYEMRPKALNLAQFFSEIIEEFQTIAGETHRIHFKNKFSGPVIVDSRLLRKILANLISNAIKYSPRSSEIVVSLEKDQKYYRFCVEDHGIGIPEEDLAHLSETFYRASNVGNIEGTGLGLAIVHQAATLLEGSLQIESTIGVGTTITVTLPYVATANKG
jgi:signal transduction histidine kinase